MDEHGFSQIPKPSAKNDATFFDKIRRFVDRVPNSVKVTAKAGALIAGKLMAEEHKDALEDVAEAQELNQERIVMEQKAEARSLQEHARFTEQVAKQFGEKKEAVVLDFMAGFKQLTPEVIQTITENTNIPSALFRSSDEQFPNGDQLGQLAQSKFTTVYLNSAAFDRNIPQYQWLELTRKVRPDREFPNKRT